MHVAIVIVSLAETKHLLDCLPCLARGTYQDFRIIVSENGGAEVAAGITASLLEAGVVTWSSLAEGLRLVPGGQPVTILANAGNLGYAGGVNAGIAEGLREGLDAVWVLNADTFPEPGALAALVTRLREGGFGMVGSRLIFAGSGLVQCWGGLAWNSWLYRGKLLGLREDAAVRPDIAAIEARTAFVSGASALVSREYIEQVGMMDGDLFLYGEDLDWGLRRGAFRLGYAHESVVRHVHGATSGSSITRRARGRINVYLTNRNAVLLARKHGGAGYPVLLLLRLAQTLEELVRTRSWRHFAWAQQGFWAGLLGRNGRPGWLR